MSMWVRMSSRGGADDEAISADTTRRRNSNRECRCDRRPQLRFLEARLLGNGIPLAIHRNRSRQGEEKGGSLSRLRFDPNPSPVLLDDPFTDRQPDARALIPPVRVETLKHLEESPRLVGVETYAVVADRKLPLGVCAPGCDMNLWRCRAAKLDGIADEVL